MYNELLWQAQKAFNETTSEQMNLLVKELGMIINVIEEQDQEIAKMSEEIKKLKEQISNKD